MIPITFYFLEPSVSTIKEVTPKEGLAGPIELGCNSIFGCCEDGITPAIESDLSGCPGMFSCLTHFIPLVSFFTP